MARLKDRQRQIPNGFQFSIPQVGWKAQPFQSFDTIVNSVETIMKSNPGLAEANKWPLERAAIADWVDETNARWCLQNGWQSFVHVHPGEGAVAPNFTIPPQQDQSRLDVAAGKIRKIVSGARTIDQWIDSNDPPADDATAERRALTCIQCPKNGKGDFTSWFAAPAAALIKFQIERLHNKRQLKTTHDEKLGVCEVCLCPMKLKVHTPLKYIAAHTTPEVLADLGDVKGCWIVSEINGK